MGHREPSNREVDESQGALRAILGHPQVATRDGVFARRRSVAINKRDNDALG